jgi:pimeloyl-ACP methyl ester carboxylesterase
MKQTVIGLIAIFAGLSMSVARADVLVLVHGYLGSAQSWDTSGITVELERNGWQRAGLYFAGPAGMRLIPAPGNTGDQKYYTVELPSTAPVLIQAFHLRQILHSITALHGNEPISIAGHSAGGVVARVALVRGDMDNIKSLITIASPHLGTGRAEQALDATDIPFPLSMVTDFFGGSAYDTVMRSRSLFVDLVRQRPGTLLYWLNNQPHPDIEYFSVVRGQPAIISGDYVVPGYSQDMNNVPALQGRSFLIRVNSSNHGLNVLDGSVIASVLAGTI